MKITIKKGLRITFSCEGQKQEKKFRDKIVDEKGNEIDLEQEITDAMRSGKKYSINVNLDEL